MCGGNSFNCILCDKKRFSDDYGEEVDPESCPTECFRHEYCGSCMGKCPFCKDKELKSFADDLSDGYISFFLKGHSAALMKFILEVDRDVVSYTETSIPLFETKEERLSLLKELAKFTHKYGNCLGYIGNSYLMKSTMPSMSEFKEMSKLSLRYS